MVKNLAGQQMIETNQRVTEEHKTMDRQMLEYWKCNASSEGMKKVVIWLDLDIKLQEQQKIQPRSCRETWVVETLNTRYVAWSNWMENSLWWKSIYGRPLTNVEHYDTST